MNPVQEANHRINDEWRRQRAIVKAVAGNNAPALARVFAGLAAADVSMVTLQAVIYGGVAPADLLGLLNRLRFPQSVNVGDPE